MTRDEKVAASKTNTQEYIDEGRLICTYALLAHVFSTKATDKTVLRDEIQKNLKSYRNDFKLKDALLLPLVRETCSLALKYKYSP